MPAFVATTSTLQEKTSYMLRDLYTANMEFRMLLCSVLVVCAVVVPRVRSQSEGAGCKDEKTGKSGICTVITKCPSALAAIQRQILFQKCPSSGTVPTVCCPNSQSTASSIATQKCKEYAKFAYTYTRSPLTTGPRNISRLDCGFKVIPLIVGGHKAKGREFPHSAAIGYDTPDGRLYLCGGSLISENFVLTAAHCHSNQYGIAKSVRLGDLNLVSTTDEAEPQEYNIADFISHPEYLFPSKYNDIMLIKLSTNAQFTRYVRPICLYTGTGQILTKSAIASGWGKTRASADTNSNDLLKVVLNFVSNEQCFKAYENNNMRILANGITDSSQICAGSMTGLNDTCEGDSGGPLQIYNLEEECMYLQIGITSFGKICGRTPAPGVYTRVSHYIDWIVQNVWP